MSVEMSRGQKISRGKLGKISPRLAATKSPTVKDIYWAAGIYEGEGNCQRTDPYVKHHGTTEVARIGQKIPWILYKIRDLFGGSVNQEKRRKLYVWMVSGARARGFLMTIYSILSPHRQLQAKNVLTWKRSDYN